MPIWTIWWWYRICIGCKPGTALVNRAAIDAISHDLGQCGTILQASEGQPIKAEAIDNLLRDSHAAPDAMSDGASFRVRGHGCRPMGCEGEFRSANDQGWYLGVGQEFCGLTADQKTLDAAAAV